MNLDLDIHSEFVCSGGPSGIETPFKIVRWIVDLSEKANFSYSLCESHNFNLKSMKKITKKQPHFIFMPTKYKQSGTKTDKMTSIL